MRPQRKKSVLKIGLFGGAFNPVHFGHLKMAKLAMRDFKLDIVYFIPSGNPPHKNREDLLPSRKRISLLKAAIKYDENFKILDIELKSNRKSYTVNTVKKIIKSFTPPYELFFLLGADQFNSLATWKGIDDLKNLVTFIVFPRGKIIEPKIKNLQWEKLKTKEIKISASLLRK